MPKAKAKTGVCYNKQALKDSMKKGYMIRAIEDGLPIGQPRLSTYGAQPYPQQSLVGSGLRTPLRSGLLANAPLSSASLFGPTRLVGSARRSYRTPLARSRIDLLGGSPYDIADPRDIDSLESLMAQIEEEMYVQEEKAQRSCIEGEETALHRYQAMSDLLDDATDALEEINANPSASLELPKYVSTVKARFARAKRGKLSDFDASSQIGL